VAPIRRPGQIHQPTGEEQIMNAWQFANESPILTAFMVWVVCEMVYKVIFHCWNRMMRMLNVRKQGWPPPHCDADGDFRPKS
jgi:hypothetical protein